MVAWLGDLPNLAQGNVMIRGMRRGGRACQTRINCHEESRQDARNRVMRLTKRRIRAGSMRARPRFGKESPALHAVSTCFHPPFLADTTKFP